MALEQPYKRFHDPTGGDLRMLEDTLSPATRGFYGATDSDIQDFLDSLNLGSYQNYGQPEEVFPGDPMRDPETGTGQRGDLMRRMDPQEFIGMQLAGDVVSLPAGHMLDASQRLYEASRSRTSPVGGMYGQESISQLGGRQSPYLDLLNILQFPSGRPYGR